MAESVEDMIFYTTEQIAEKFIKDGWNKNTSFEELSLKEAEEKGYTFAVNGINKGRKYFRMKVSNTIYNDRGKAVMYDIPACK